eukprot:1159696-Pelagomonas_calceolata.AAC.22
MARAGGLLQVWRQSSFLFVNAPVLEHKTSAWLQHIFCSSCMLEQSYGLLSLSSMHQGMLVSA